MIEKLICLNVSFFLIGVGLFICSCSTSKEDPAKIYATVITPAGSIDPDFNPEFLSLPFNLGKVYSENGDQQIIIIAPTLKSGQRVAISPLASVTIEEGGTFQSYIVAVLSDELIETSSLHNFTDFITDQNHIKSTIHHYLEQKSGIKSYTSVTWSEDIQL